MSSVVLKHKSSSHNIALSERQSKRSKKEFPVKRGQYNSYQDADLDLVSTFECIDEFKESNGKDGLSIGKAALKIKIPRRTLARWYNQWLNLDRPENFHLGESRGRHTSMNTKEEAKLDELLEEKYISKNEILVDETISVEALSLMNSSRGHQHLLRSGKRSQTFQASQHWARNFRKRHRLSVRTPSRTHVAAMTDDRLDQTIDYIAQMHVAVAKYGKTLTLGADETPLRSVAQNRTTIARKGTESVKLRKVGNEKQQLTAMLAISVSGEKLKPMVIHKGKTQRCLTNLDLGNDIVGAYSKNGWINGLLMIKFLQDSVLPFTQGRPCALSLDDFDAHWTNEVQIFAAANHIELIRVPPGITGDFQSLDVRINGILKMRQFKMQRLERIENPARKFNLQDAVRYFKSGWSKVTRCDIKSSWSPLKFP